MSDQPISLRQLRETATERIADHRGMSIDPSRVLALVEAVEATHERDAAYADLERLQALPVSQVFAERGEAWPEKDEAGPEWAFESSERVWGPLRERCRLADDRLVGALARFTDHKETR